MSDIPMVGDEVFMPFMGDDVRIEVADVPGDQPCAETDGCYFVTDQYGEEHLVEKDGDDWVVASADALSDKGGEALMARTGARRSPGN